MADGNVGKRCWACKITKPATEFWKASRSKDGLQAECKSCYFARAKTPKRLRQKCASVVRYHKTAKGKAASAAWLRTPKGRAFQASVRKRISGTEENRARAAVGQKVHRGKMPSARTLQCVRCGKPAEHYHHHLGYSREHRYHVIPVCAQCHKDIEGKPFSADVNPGR